MSKKPGAIVCDFERGQLVLDNESIKAYDAQGQLLWSFVGDTFTVPKDSPFLSVIDHARELLDRGAVVGVRFEEGQP